MRLSHAAAAATLVFDDPNLLPDGGLLPVLALAEKINLAGLVEERLHRARKR